MGNSVAIVARGRSLEKCESKLMGFPKKKKHFQFQPASACTAKRELCQLQNTPTTYDCLSQPLSESTVFYACT